MAVGKIHQPRTNDILLEESSPEEMNNVEGKALHEVFNKDSISNHQAKESFQPISTIPELTPPEKTALNPTTTLQLEPKVALNNVDVKSVIIPSMERVMMDVLAAQFELDKYRATVSQDVFNRFEKLSKLMQKDLDVIKASVDKQQNIGTYIGYLQNFATALSAICLLASFAASGGVAAAPVVALATAGPYFAAAFKALLYGADGFTKRSKNLNEAKMTDYKHNHKMLQDKTDSQHNHVNDLAEAEGIYQEHLIKIANRLQQLSEQVNSISR